MPLYASLLSLTKAVFSSLEARMQSQEASIVAGLPDRKAMLAAAATLLVAYSNCSLIGVKAKPGVPLAPKCTAGIALYDVQLLHSLRGVGHGCARMHLQLQ